MSKRWRLTQRLEKLVLFCAVLSAVFAVEAHGQCPLKCGKEYRLKTHDGTVVQGRLRTYDGNSITIYSRGRGSRTFSIGDIGQAYVVRRNSASGAVLGALVGTGVGIWIKSNEPDDNKNTIVDLEGLEQLAAALAGAVVGGVIGGLVGHHIQTLGPVKLEALPMCGYQRGGSTPVGVSIAISL